MLVFPRSPFVLSRSRAGGRPGCCFLLFMLVAALFVGWFCVASGTLAGLVANKPLFSLPLSLPSLAVRAEHVGASDVVTGQPTLSAAFVNQVLARAFSPALGTGQALYALSEKYGIDDAYALAFFRHESQYGTTGMAQVTRSLGNIRCSLGYSCINGYRAYSSWQAGYADWYELLKDGYLTGQVSKRCPCVTVEQIVPVYAPAADGNDEQAYIRAVLSAVAAWRAGRLLV